MNAFDVKGKTALITGATRGIGLGAAQALAQSGANVMLVGRDEAELQQAAVELRKENVEVTVLPFDLLKSKEIAPWLEGVFAQHGTPHILVNSAGMSKRGPAIEQTLEDWDDVLALNTTAIFEVSRCWARKLIGEARPGKCVNIASLMTAAARPGTSPYTASKGAVGQLTKVLAVEWAQHGILVNAIAPGYINTDLNKALVADEKFDAWVKGRCPLGRWGLPADIAWPIVFLCSPAAGFITGQVIYVDGGWLATF